MQMPTKKSKWENYYNEAKETIDRLQKENEDLRKILDAQVKTNDRVGDIMRDQTDMVHEQITEHNSEKQELYKTIEKLSKEVVRLGGDLDNLGN